MKEQVLNLKKCVRFYLMKIMSIWFYVVYFRESCIFCCFNFRDANGLKYFNDKIQLILLINLKLNYNSNITFQLHAFSQKLKLYAYVLFIITKIDFLRILMSEMKIV